MQVERSATLQQQVDARLTGAADALQSHLNAGTELPEQARRCNVCVAVRRAVANMAGICPRLVETGCVRAYKETERRLT